VLILHVIVAHFCLRKFSNTDAPCPAFPKIVSLDWEGRWILLFYSISSNVAEVADNLIVFL